MYKINQLIGTSALNQEYACKTHLNCLYMIYKIIWWIMVIYAEQRKLSSLPKANPELAHQLKF